MKVVDVVVILVLSLIVWLIFKFFHMQLDLLSTVPVVAFFTIVVLGFRFLLKRLRKGKSK